MKRRSQVQVPRSGTVLITGHHCPKTGWWSPVLTGGEARYITEGSLMPAAGGRPVMWTPSRWSESPAPGPGRP